METPLILMLMLAFGFAASSFEQRLVARGLRSLGGAEYLALGFIAGPHVLGLLTADRLMGLEGVVVLAGGIIGFTTGLGLPMRRPSFETLLDIRFGITTAFLTAAVVGAASFVTLTRLFSGPGLVEGSLVLGFAAAVSSRDALRAAKVSHRAEGPIARLLPNASVAGRVLAVVGFGLTIAASPDLHSPILNLGPLAWPLVELAAGVVCGLIFHVFVGDQRDRQMLMVASLGLLFLVAGIADVLRLAPLFVGMVAGATVAAASPVAPMLRDTALPLERPTIVVLFLYGGARFDASSWNALLLAIGFVALRIAALSLSARVATRAHPQVAADLSGLGRGFAVQGALAAAMAIGFGHVLPGETGRVVETTILLAAVLNTPLAWSAASDLLKDAGETGRAPANGSSAVTS